MYAFILDVCKLPVIVVASSREITHYFTINNVTNSTKLVNSDAFDIAFDSTTGRLYFYNLSDTFYSMNLDGSYVRTVVELKNVKRFTIDGKNKRIYYVHGLTDKIRFVNMTSLQDNEFVSSPELTGTKDLDMDVKNG